MDGTVRRLPGKVSGAGHRDDQMQRRELPAGWDRNLPVFRPMPKGIAGREASGKVLNVLAQNIPWFLGGSADLGPSNKTTLKYEGAGDFQADTRREEPAFRHPRACDGGDRERAVAVQAAALRRDLLHLQRLRPARHPAVGNDGITHTLVFTHDAMGDGEDGPTHQPVEQLCRACHPRAGRARPGDANEVVRLTATSCNCGISRPSWPCRGSRCLPWTGAGTAPASGVARGAYVLADPPGGTPK